MARDEDDFRIRPGNVRDRSGARASDVATLFKHLRFAGVQIVTLAEGESPSFMSASKAR